MSVYTSVSRAALAAWLAPLSVGDLVEFAGISAGVQNSNYFVTTTRGRWVLTLYESLAPDAVDAYLHLMADLAARGIPCPLPVTDPQGHVWRSLAGHPAALLSCLAGEPLLVPGEPQLQALGRLMANLHRAGQAGVPAPANPCGPDWRQRTGEAMMPLLATEDAGLLQQALREDRELPWRELPSGVIHADLFRDNVLWVDGQLSGVLDFYFAGTDAWIYDLAIAANDWCDTDAAVAALWAGYESIRPLQAIERAVWPAMRRVAALRFWLLRLERLHRPPPGEVVTLKDPAPLRDLLVRLALAEGTGPR